MPLPDAILNELPDQYKEDPTLIRFNSVEDLAKSYLESRSLVGNSIRIPSEDAGEEDRQKFLEKLVNNAPELMVKPDLSEPDQSNEFYRTIGMPEKPEQYEKPEGVALNDEVENELRTVLHEAGLSNAQFQKVLGAFDEREKARQEVMQGQADSATADLKGKWGMTFEDRMKAAEKMNAEYYPGRDFGQVSPAEIESLYNMHSSLTGKPAPAAHQEGAPTGVTPDEAKERAAEIMRKIHAKKDELPQAEVMALVKKRMKLLIEAGVVEGDVNDLNAHG